MHQSRESLTPVRFGPTRPLAEKANMKGTLKTLLAPWALLAAATAATTGCKEDNPPPPPLPAAESAEAPKPLELKPVDAAVPEEEDEKPKGGGGGRRTSGLAACCAALQQNSTMAPEPTKTYMVQAAALCSAAAAQGQDKAAAMGMIMGALKGAGMPAASMVKMRALS